MSEPTDRDREIREALELRYELITLFASSKERRVESNIWEMKYGGYGPTPLAATKDWAARNGMKWELPK